MSVRKADDFIAHVERQFDWYKAKAGYPAPDPAEGASALTGANSIAAKHDILTN